MPNQESTPLTQSIPETGENPPGSCGASLVSVSDLYPLWKRSHPEGDLTLVDRRRYLIAPRGCAYAVLALLVVTVAAAVILFLAREAWLAALGRFLVYRESPRQADAIIVLGGGDETRSALGAALYHTGFAPVVITPAGGKESYLLYQKDTPADQLRRAGVPVEAIHVLKAPLTTYEEAQMSLSLLRAMGASRVLLVTDTYHSRRARDIFLSLFDTAGIEVVTVPSEPEWFDPDAWWKSERGALVVFNEYAKYVWFWLGGHG